VKTKNFKILYLTLILGAAAVGLYFLSDFNYILFHTLIEFTSIVFGVCSFIIAVSTTYITKNVFMVLLSTGIFTSSLLDFLYTLFYKGLNIFKGSDSNLSAQLWVSARFVQIAGIFAAVFIIDMILTRRYIIITSVLFPIVFAVFIATIFLFPIFPVCYIEGYGQTQFKVITEYLLSSLAAVSIILYTLKKQKLGKQNYRFIILSLSFFILSELSFTIYTDIYGFFNILGHYFKLASFYFIYRFFIETNLRDPFTILFNNLKGTNEKLQFITTHDNLTGFLNQSSALDEIKKQFEIAKRFKKPFSVIIIDIDDFKELNKQSGHPFGDRAIKYLSKIIKNSVRDVDIKGRYGGDEFIISPLEVSAANAITISQKIQENLDLALISEETPFEKFQISTGISGIRGKRTFDEIIDKAEKALLKSKKLGKNRVTLIR